MTRAIVVKEHPAALLALIKSSLFERILDNITISCIINCIEPNYTRFSTVITEKYKRSLYEQDGSVVLFQLKKIDSS
jgi:hypothetical protein